MGSTDGIAGFGSMAEDPFLLLVMAALAGVWLALVDLVGQPDVLDVLGLLAWSGGAAAVVIAACALLLRPDARPQGALFPRQAAQAAWGGRRRKRRGGVFGWAVVPLGEAYAGTWALALYGLYALGVAVGRTTAALRRSAAALSALALYGLVILLGARSRAGV